IFTNARDRRELVQNAVDLHCRNGSTAQRRQQNATERIAQRQTKTAFERLGNKNRLSTALGAELNLVRLNQFLPVFLDHGFILPLPCHHPIVAGVLEPPMTPDGAISRKGIRRGASYADGNHCAEWA